MAFTTESSLFWSERVEPPTRINEAPHLTAVFAVSAALAGEKSSGSISAATRVPLFALEMRRFSTGPGADKLSTGFGEIVHERVVDVDVGPLGRVPHLPAQPAGEVAAGDVIHLVV